MKIYEIEIDGQFFRIPAQRIAGMTWIHVNGKTVSIEKKTESWNKKEKSGGHPGEILSPMPGKITKLLKKVGDQVEKGDVVVVVEAMKMEYSLKSNTKGRLTSIGCQVGEQVNLGKILCHIEEETT